MSDTIQTTGVHVRPELLTVADTVARDKGIDRDEVLEAMEQAIQRAGRSKYGHEHDIRAHIDRNTGEITLARYIEVVADDEVENEFTAAIGRSSKGLISHLLRKRDAILELSSRVGESEEFPIATETETRVIRRGHRAELGDQGEVVIRRPSVEDNHGQQVLPRLEEIQRVREIEVLRSTGFARSA